MVVLFILPLFVFVEASGNNSIMNLTEKVLSTIGYEYLKLKYSRPNLPINFSFLLWNILNLNSPIMFIGLIIFVFMEY